MKILNTFFLAMVLLSCNSDDNNETDFVYSIGFEMIVKNGGGIDLLNQNSPNTLNTNDIKLYYLINDVSEEVYNPNLDLPRNYMIYEHSDGFYRIKIFPNYAQSEEFPTTYIEWGENDTDTIKCQFKYTNNSIALTKVWFNEILELDTESGTGFTFEVIK